MTSLYELTAETVNKLSDVDSDVDVSYIIGDLRNKQSNVLMYIKNLASDSLDIKNHIKSCKKRMDTVNKNIDYLKDAVSSSMTIMGQNKVETALITATLRKPSSSLDIDDEDVPDSFKMFKESHVIDKDKIRVALGEGTELSWARFKERQSLMIYESMGVKDE